MLALCLLKLLSWSVALGSGTSGGTLAPLFTIGGALGGVLGAVFVTCAPWLHVDPHVAALVCMAAIFAGASRAFLTSVVFAFETTQQPHGLLPLLTACAAAYLVSGLMMRNTIMTEKIARRGVRVPAEYAADFLDRIAVGDACSRHVVTLRTSQALAEVREWLATGDMAAKHQGFPIVDDEGQLKGVLTRRDLLDVNVSNDAVLGALLWRLPLVVREDHTLREAADHMVEADVGRLVVLGGEGMRQMVGILTRGDLLAAHARRLRESRETSRHLGNKRVA
jgi:CBS domain-containing protein